MNINTSPTMIQSLKSNYDNGKLSFNPPMQRRVGQWADKPKSLWIHSILANYPLPSIYVWEHDGVKYVIDGIQRLHSTFTFLDDEYPIHKETPEVILEEEQYDITKKRYSQLPLDLQSDIRRTKLNIISISDCDYETAADIFYRLNSSIPLSVNQRGRARYEKDLIERFDSIIASDFIKNHLQLTKAQYRKEDDLTVLIQTIMLFCHKLDVKEVTNFSSGACDKFMSEGVPDGILDTIEEAINYLEIVFKETGHKIRKLSAPMLIWMGYVGYRDGIDFKVFLRWYDYFLCDEKIQDSYTEQCGQGTTGKLKILGRTLVMEDSFSYFMKNKFLFINEKAQEEPDLIEEEYEETITED